MSNSKAYSKKATSRSSVILVIEGVGHVVSFKNSKQIIGAKSNRPRLITDPKKQKQMRAIILSFEQQLRSMFPTNETGTATGCSLLCWIASYLPLDDSLKWIPEINVRFQHVSKGKEGAIVEIERIDTPSEMPNGCTQETLL